MTPVVTAEEALVIVQRAVATVLAVDAASVDRRTRFRDDLKADSLALLEILQIVEDALVAQAGPGFEIPDEDLGRLVTVADAVDYAVTRP
ncbi:MAG: acyl carrier protein [Frankiales bacterium]|jgi:acyl carrier protein|nr:acyl carrier protein [Frankiales bacterium]